MGLGNVGNLGLNSLNKASKEKPLKVYAKDFDNNGTIDAIPSVFLRIQLAFFKNFHSLVGMI